jgi:hypothetical protein
MPAGHYGCVVRGSGFRPGYCFARSSCSFACCNCR